ncbi:MAG: protein kinase, partial [Acidimicrobiales bacterium]
AEKSNGALYRLHVMSLGDLHDNLGRLYGGRYRMVRPVGRGSSAQVFLADDIKLDRQVAVKLLHESLAGDRVFLERFKDEAQRCAQLSQQNIVTVYDWSGEDRPYIVTEFLGGGSLGAMIDAGNLLSPAQALVVGLGAAKALEYASNRGLVHRDIKPANLLFDVDGQVRVADFGLTLALAEAGRTQPGDEMLGTVRYASPEQARGESLSEKSDVYSLALSLVEAVTGEVPFQGDSPLGTLMARTERDMVVPHELGRLEVTLSKAGALDPHERPTATELKVALLAAAESMAPPEKLPLMGTQAPVGAVTERLAPTQIGVPGTSQPASVVVDQTTAPKRKWPWVIFALLVLGGAATAGYFAYVANQTSSFLVPDLLDVPEGEALARIDRNGWSVQAPLFLRDDDVAEGRVISTDPPAGTDLAEGEAFVYTLSLGPTNNTVPSDGLLGQPADFVEEQLLALGFGVNFANPEFSEAVSKGSVVSVGDAGRDLPKGTEIIVTVSNGPPPRAVPADLIGADVNAVTQQLLDLRLVPVVRGVFDSQVEEGLVLRVFPREGTEVAADTEIDIVISKGPPPRAVPGVIGLTVEEATRALIAFGFTVEIADGPSDGIVVGQNPLSDEEANFGSVVELFTREPDPDPEAENSDGENADG